jgi:hypothetical protein
MKPRFYTIIKDAVERGTYAGFQRAHKHVDDPSESIIAENVVHQIMNELTLRFDFSDSL